MSNLDKYLELKVKELVRPLSVELEPWQIERHQIYSYLLMAITHYYWNGRKYGDEYEYPLNPDPTGEGKFLRGDYRGHNIAALAVNRKGEIIDFEFNHNELFSSSAEHAESRLIKRIFALIGTPLNVSGYPDRVPPPELIQKGGVAKAFKIKTDKTFRYTTDMKGMTVYTSLESCSQCSGIMALGRLKEVIFIQDDPGMYYIGNILRRLTENTGLQAPLPIAGSRVQIPEYQKLNESYSRFQELQENEVGDPFRIQKSTEKKEYSASMTSFLCTRAAYDIYGNGTKKFIQFATKYPHSSPGKDTLSNEDVLRAAKRFYNYATQIGQRGTPHKS